MSATVHSRRLGRSVGRITLVTGAAMVALVATLAATILTVRLHARTPLDRSDAEVVADAVPRLTFLRHAIDRGADEEMQQLFPEGHFFLHVLYGLSWVDVGTRDPDQRDRALTESRRALAALDSTAGRAPFSPSLDPPYGVFHAGWSSWLRGGVVRLAGGPTAAPTEATRLTSDIAALAAAFDRQLTATGSPFLPAYPGQAWPVDSTVGIAAVRLADHLTGGTTYTELTRRWLTAADARRDPATGLLPHRVDPADGQPVEGARATSQTMALRFLREVYPVEATRDWARFRDLFVSNVPGAPGLREHPQGVDLPGDVDSGPLIFGLSASASAVALGDAVLFGDRRSANALTGLAETTGLAIEYDNQRRYLGGVLPVGDAFLTWSLTATGWIVPTADTVAPAGGPSPWWRLPWLLAVALLLPPWWLLLWLILAGTRASQVPAGRRLR
ncbi:hypothetical protein [Micromonospora polyrhachis]|uniref:Linalool dehydratase/isomerase domain-containing protein n=1 Tax=Micromonospora polyrhachis TaxID=1282883 RepID=A0A7W7WNG4_9ACTN|nr:hypothetical protein [Micromonospora polyrhachis]MBB4957198.1 hypothetical protein [Micromonospora polyrhachis]